MMKKRLIFFSLFLLLIAGFLSITSQPTQAQYTTLPACTLKIKDKTYCINNLKVKCECTFVRSVGDIVCRWNTTSTVCGITPTVDIPPTVPPPGPLETPTPIPTNAPLPTSINTPIPTWIIELAPVCPSGMTQKKPLRMFRIIWPQEGQQSYEFDCINDDHSIGNHTMEITPKNILNGIQGIYVGLEDEMRDGEARVCSEGISLEPSSIEPSVPVITGSYPTSGDFVVFAKYMNPYNWMAHWQWNRLTGGNYTIKFNLPDSMCEVIPTDKAILTITSPPGCIHKNLGDANCDDKIDLTDLGIWACQILNDNCGEAEEASNFDLVNGININDFEIWRRTYQKTIVVDETTPNPIETTLTPTRSTETGLCDWCGEECLGPGEERFWCGPTPSSPEARCYYDDQLKDCIAKLPKPADPEITPVAETTVIPIDVTECYFCGRECISTKIKINCLDVMPPEGSICSFNPETNSCQISNDGNVDL